MSKGKRGLGLNRPCTKCGAEVPSLFVSPVQDGLCGKCTDAAMRAKKRSGKTEIREVFLDRAPVLRMILLLAIGLVAGFALAILIAAAAPGAWDGIAGPIKGLFS